MKKTIFKHISDSLYLHIFYISIIVIIFIGVANGNVRATSEDVRYDVDNDGKVSSQDYVEIKNYIMENE